MKNLVIVAAVGLMSIPAFARIIEQTNFLALKSAMKEVSASENGNQMSGIRINKTSIGRSHKFTIEFEYEECTVSVRSHSVVESIGRPPISRSRVEIDDVTECEY